MQRSYFKWSNAFDLAIYLLTIIFVFELNFLKDYPFGPGCQYTKPQHEHIYQCGMWPIGSILMISVWLNLLIQLTQLPFFGIFLMMFFNILNTMKKLSLFILIFVVAFGIGFNILFVNNVSFQYQQALLNL